MKKTDFLTYKDKPLVRKGNEIYYGDMSQSHVMRFEILSTKNTENGEMPEKVKVQLLKSDIQLPEKERVVKETTKYSFYEALDVGFVWIERALKE
ncbi:MAG: hypothetical protein ACOYJS_06160 [Acutalibacteraceae bacterium]|jgi:hypothetical protein